MTGAAGLAARKDALLEAVLPNVLFDGWSAAALRAGARAIGLPEAEIPTLFPDGPAEAARWLDDWADRGMLKELAGRDLGALKLRERVAAAVEARLAALAPHREAVRRAIAAKLSPFGLGRAAQTIYRTVDAIWYAVGDASTDFSFYTKRATLAGIYAATVLYWLNDNSEGAADTHAFLARRLAELTRLPKLREGVQRGLRGVVAPFEILRREFRR